MTTNTVTIPAVVRMVHPKFPDGIEVDLRRFASDADRGIAFASGLTRIAADQVGAKTYVPGAADTVEAARKRIESLLLNPAGGSRAVDDLRDILATSIGAKRLITRGIVDAMEAEQLARFTDRATIATLGGIVGASAARIGELADLSDGATEADRATIIATVGAALKVKADAAKAKADAKPKKVAKK